MNVRSIISSALPLWVRDQLGSTRVIAALALIGAIGLGNNSDASVMTFDDIDLGSNTRSNFPYADYGGINWQQRSFGGQWGVAREGDSQILVGMHAHSGTQVGWNYDGPGGLWINFDTPTNFNGAWFSIFGVGYGAVNPSTPFGSLNSKTIEIIGYDSSYSELGRSATIDLDDSWKYLDASILNVSRVLFRHEYLASGNSWFTVDDITFGLPIAGTDPPTVPEPATLALVAAAVLGVAATRRRRPTITAD